MDYRKFGADYVIRLDRGEEVVSSLTALCIKEKIGLASVQALGATDRALVCVYDVAAKVFHRRELTGPMEIASLVGTVTSRDGAPYLHLHVALCRADQTACGGHVLSLTVSATCEMTLHTLNGEVGRQLDDDTGLNLFRFS